LCLAGRGPNSNSLFLPLAAVVAVAEKLSAILLTSAPAKANSLFSPTDCSPVYRWFPLGRTSLAEIPGTLAGKDRCSFCYPVHQMGITG